MPKKLYCSKCHTELVQRRAVERDTKRILDLVDCDHDCGERKELKEAETNPHEIAAFHRKANKAKNAPKRSPKDVLDSFPTPNSVQNLNKGNAATRSSREELKTSGAPPSIINAPGLATGLFI